MESELDEEICFPMVPSSSNIVADIAADIAQNSTIVEEGPRPKGIPLNREEVRLLIKLVEMSPVVFNKCMNATSNQQKDIAWAKITDDFNALITSGPRTREQLRLKWENLKKNARRRSTRIAMNNLQSKATQDYIPSDDILDRVLVILSSAYDRNPMHYGGDGAEEETDTIEQEPMLVEVQCIENKPTVIDPLNMSPNSPNSPQSKQVTPPHTVSKGKVKRQEQADDVKASVKARNLAIADYYKEKKRHEEELFALKKRKLELEILELENKFVKHE